MPQQSPEILRKELIMLVQENRQAAAALHTIFELCVEMGVLSLKEFSRRSQLADEQDDGPEDAGSV